VYVASRADNFVRILKLSPGELRAGWVNLASTQRATPSAALRKNHTSGTAHLARSSRDVGAADRCGSAAPGSRTCRLCRLCWWRSSQRRCYRVAQRQRYSDQDYSEGYELD